MHIAVFFSLLGWASSVFLLFSPLPAYMAAVKLWSAVGISFEYILATNVSQIAWTLYGVKTEEFAILWISLLGTAVTICYLIVYRVIAGGIAIFLLVYVTCSIVSVGAVLRWMPMDLLGSACMVLSIANCLAALFQTREAIKERNPSLIDYTITAAMLVCGVSWAGYGISVSDVYIALPNFVSICVAIFNLNVRKWLEGEFCLAKIPNWLQRWGRRYRKRKGESMWV